MDITAVLQGASRAPQLQPALNAAQRELGDVAPRQVEELIKLLETALARPEQYAEIRKAAIADDMVNAEDLPEQFDPQLVASLLVMLYRLREAPAPEVAMAGGGLARMRTLASRGRYGDTMLAHISPREAAMLRARGGAGTINPATGLPQFFSLKDFVRVALPIAATFIAPGLGTAIGTALGASGATAAIVGQAVIGGLASGLTGGNVLQGSVLGGLGAGLGTALGSGVSDALGLGLGTTGQSMLGGALIGGVTGAATGQGFGRGALAGAAGAGLGAVTQGVAPGALGAGIGAGGQMAGNMLTAGYKPKEALTGGALAGLASGLMYKPPEGPGLKVRPSEAALQSLKTGTGGVDYSLATTQGAQAAPATPAAPATTNLMRFAPLALMAMSSAPPAVQQAVTQLSPQQQEYFNRPNVQWDWNRLQSDAAAANMSLAQYMATNWPRITGYSSSPAAPDARQGAYVMPSASAPPAAAPGMAMGGRYANGGGALQAVARFVRGGGSGRDDTINARLSDGEYVMDAETVAMLGDGSTSEGARRLDAMRAQLRKHKGKALARGKFSPNAKSPLSYLQGAA